MKPLALTSALLLVACVASSFAFRSRVRRGPPKESASGTTSASEASKTPVIVELFTSEGCSSCPPADALLARLSSAQGVPGAEIIALEEHVDYWNDLGWADPFSSAQFSRRQEAYAETSGEGSVYTPQMVVDGQKSFVGSNRNRAQQAIAEAARGKKSPVRLRLIIVGSGIALAVSVPRLENSTPGDVAEVYLAITEDGLTSAVQRGENAGLSLSHAAVVRSFKKIGLASASAETPFTDASDLKIEPGWKASRLHAVVFVQELRSRRVLGAASLPLQ